ncbi:MAG: DUF58 domain-containing protein, partial [Hyphomicrobiaceae bacterium]
MALIPQKAAQQKVLDETRAKLLDVEASAHDLADRVPELLLEAQRIAATIVHGTHGRKRPGPGETFWQFRQMQAGDPTHLIDWRRSAASDHLFIREREWEAAHTAWVWADLSPSMVFHSHLVPTQKRDRALVLAFALIELLVRAGERTSLMGVNNPTQSRKATTRIAEMLAARLREAPLTQSLPPEERVGRFHTVLWISDFLDPLGPLEERMRTLAGSGVNGHLVQVLDPAEETLAYEGRIEFVGVEGSERWLADRAESLRDRYRERLDAHRTQLKDICRSLGWSFLVHHTDRAATEPVLALNLRLAGG